MKQVNPEHEFKTLFVAGGVTYRPRGEAAESQKQEYLKKIIGDSKDILIVTQYIHSGGTVYELARLIKELGVNTVDVSTLSAQGPEDYVSEKIQSDNLFIGGGVTAAQHYLNDYHNILSGVSKLKEYSPEPIRLDKAIKTGERPRSRYLSPEEEMQMLYFMERNDNTPLSKEEESAIQENINRTRETIKTLATEVVKEVWGSPENN
jgi:hypothetical protein